MKQPIIGIVGPTGAGKTTLAENLAKHFGVDLQLELPSQNPFLAQFYQELQDGGHAPTALKSQLFFLLAAQAQAQRIAVGHKKGVAWDVPFYGHKMYADLLAEQQIMSTADYEIYTHVYELCLATSPKPDIIVVVTTDIETLCERINKRGRVMELATPRTYWQRQIEYWQRQLASHTTTNGIKLLEVNSKDINWSRKKGATLVWEKIQSLVYA